MLATDSNVPIDYLSPIFIQVTMSRHVKYMTLRGCMSSTWWLEGAIIHLYGESMGYSHCQIDSPFQGVTMWA